MSDPHSYDESIPVLTEVVPELAPGPAVEAEPEPASNFEPSGFEASMASTLDIPAEAPPPPVQPMPPVHDDDMAPMAAVSEDAWKTLEERLVARVLERLQDRIAMVLEDEIRTQMAPILDHVVARMAVELHAGLETTVTQVVTRAVAQELAHLHWNPA